MQRRNGVGEKSLEPKIKQLVTQRSIIARHDKMNTLKTAFKAGITLNSGRADLLNVLEVRISQTSQQQNHDRHCPRGRSFYWIYGL